MIPQRIVALFGALVLFLCQCVLSQEPSPSPETPNTVTQLVSFQDTSIASTNSSLRFLNEFPEMADVTLNMWVYFRHFSPAVEIIVSYFAFNNDLLHLWHDFKLEILVMRVQGYRLTTPIRLPLYMWNHITISIELASAKYHVLVNDREVASNLTTDYEEMTGKNLPGGGILVLGQDQDSPAGGYSVQQSFSGNLADFCVLPEYIPSEKLKDFKCFEHVSDKPSLLLDSVEDWEFEGDVKASLINRSLLDYTLKQPYVIPPVRLYFPAALKFCQTLGFPMALPKSEEENARLFAESVVFEEQCLTAFSSIIWIGANGNLTNLKWQSSADGTPITYDKLDKGFSYVTESRQCITMGSSLYPAIWYSLPCAKYAPCPACENSPVNSIQIRGLCKESQLDRQMHIHGTMNLRPVFHGTSYTKMWWDNTSWVLTSRRQPDLSAKMLSDDPDDYPVGLHKWQISGDDCPPQEEIDLLFTVCGEESFPCNDGTCVLMSQRCDLRAHCDDGSDELGCDKVFIGADYKKTLPPPPPENEDVLNVTLNMVITAIRALDLLDQTVTMDVQLVSQWEDARLNYADLQPEQYKNQVQDMERLWLPRLITTDDTGSLVDLLNRDSFLVVIQGSNPLPSDDTRYIKAIVFPGSGNPLLLQKELSITFQCQFDLLWFPFDNQRCSINLRLNDVESKLVKMIASEPQYIGPEKLLEYQVGEITLRAGPKGSETEHIQKLTIVFTNLFRYYLANSYLPSFLLVVISYSTFYFRVEDFNERIMVSITAMLVLVALFQQTSSTILKTTYLKLIDVWYMVCIIVDFIIVILHVIIDYMRYIDDNVVKVFPSSGGSKGSKQLFRGNDMPKKFNMLSRIFLPIIFCLFLAVYGTIAAVQYFIG